MAQEVVNSQKMTMDEQPEDLNPLTSQLQQLQAQLNELIQSEEKIVQEIAWYDSINPQVVNTELQQLQASLGHLQGQRLALEDELRSLEQQREQLNSQIGSWWNPLNWFDNRQRQLRQKLESLRHQQQTQRSALDSVNRQVSGLEHKKQQISDLLSRYMRFDKQAHEDELRAVKRQISLTQEKLDFLKKRWQAVEEALEPIKAEMQRLGETVNELEKKLCLAQQFIVELSNAPNAYARFQIHRRCEQLLGDDSPPRIIRQCTSQLKQVERDKKKLRDRAEKIARRAARYIEKVILDGNNLCYEDNAFIGLAVLKVLVPVLAQRYKVIVVFDASIHHLLKTGADKIRAELGKWSTVNIVPKRHVADETILDLAGEESTTYIISNDRYSDFSDMPAVQEGRVLRHEIVDGKIIIRDLEISIAYRNGR